MAGDGTTFEGGIRTAILSPFRWVLFIVALVLGVVVGRILIDGSGLAGKIAPEDTPLQTSSLEQEFAVAQQCPDFLGSTHERAQRWVQWVSVTFLEPQKHPEKAAGTSKANLGKTDIEAAFQRGVDRLGMELTAVPHGVLILTARLAIVVSFIPTLALGFVLALLDGLAARSIRRYAGARESATIYHRTKYHNVVFVTVVTVAYLWWPWPAVPNPYAILAVIFSALLLRFQAKFYKKYV